MAADTELTFKTWQELDPTGREKPANAPVWLELPTDLRPQPVVQPRPKDDYEPINAFDRLNGDVCHRGNCANSVPGREFSH